MKYIKLVLVVGVIAAISGCTTASIYFDNKSKNNSEKDLYKVMRHVQK